jgi:hypothetical protein
MEDGMGGISLTLLSAPRLVPPLGAAEVSKTVASGFSVWVWQRKLAAVLA